jgi:hypothetical protein
MSAIQVAAVLPDWELFASQNEAHHTEPHQEAVLPDWEPMPEPEPLAQATADEAACHILSTMVDLYEEYHTDVQEFGLTFISLAYYIMRNTEAPAYLKAQPAIGAQLRTYNNYLWANCPSIITTLYQFSDLLTSIGF